MFSVSAQVILAGVLRRSMPGMQRHPDGDEHFEVVKEDEGVVLPDDGRKAPMRSAPRVSACTSIANAGAQFGPYRARELWCSDEDISFMGPAGRAFRDNRSLFIAQNTLLATVNSVSRHHLAGLSLGRSGRSREWHAVSLMDVLWFHESLTVDTLSLRPVNRMASRDMISGLVEGNERCLSQAKTLLRKVSSLIRESPWPERPDIEAIYKVMQEVYRETRIPSQDGRILLQGDNTL